jgi:Bacteriophage replication gene A protein (GPA)
MSEPDVIAMLKGIGTPECHAWRRKVFPAFGRLAGLVAHRYREVAETHGYVEANRWLGQRLKALKFGHTGLKITVGPAQLADYCKAKARNTERQIHEVVESVGKEAAPEIIRAALENSGINFPLGEEYEQEDVIAAMARLCDARWWKSQLRPKLFRQCEDYIRGLGAVNSQREIYVSNFSLHRRLEQKRSNAKLLQMMEAENSEGQKYTLSELAELSPANPVNRRAELMVRARGYENYARASAENYQGLFFTLTCPSKYHAAMKYGRVNPKYDGSSVADAQAHLNSVWQRVRAAWDRLGIKPFGFRVAEPHHDGTPHWHLLLFVPTTQVADVQEIFERYALEVDGGESGAELYRLKTVVIDPKKGSATGYIAKYVAKNIDGHGLATDLYGRDAIDSAIRIEAWASIHGIRQFQQIGGASVTVWRELRRLSAEDLDAGLMANLTRAADNSDWALFNELMGGVVCARKERPVRPMMIEREEKNRYGEATRSIKGLWSRACPFVTRLYNWTIRCVLLSEKQQDSEDGVGFGAVQSNAPPWSTVNNCTCQAPIEEIA